ncbi:MAG: GNAT family N-acetyltransferase [Pseudomonadota bacterium]
MPLTYRRMQPEDVSAALAVRLSTKENAVTLDELEHDYGVTPQSMEDDLRSNANGWVCEDGGRLVGFSMGNGLNGEIAVVAVAPGYEGRGIGKTVLAHTQNWLFSLGYSEVWLLANPDPDIRATGFYKKLGWSATGVMKGHDQVLKLKNPRQ